MELDFEKKTIIIWMGGEKAVIKFESLSSKQSKIKNQIELT